MHIELVIAKLVTVGLGLLIAFHAFRGYRAYGTEPLLYVAIGFVFISVGSVIEGVLFELSELTIFQASAVQTATVAIGMVIVLYSLYGSMPEVTGDDRDA